MGIAEGSLIAGRFEIIERAGVGGMAEVFRARDAHEGVEVALKVLRPTEGKTAARFAREAALLAKLSHPRLVRYVDHGTTADDRPWIAMEWLDGETLRARLARDPLTTRETLTVIEGVAEGLAVAHRAGVLHRDVKPSNVFLVGKRPDDVRLIDFGIARFADLHGDLTETGVRVGTYSYMSPEQAWGRRELGPATDVFSLGCVFFACLTGRKPFAAKHSTAVLAKILLEPPPRVSWLRPDIAPDIDQLVWRMLAKEPSARPRDADALLAELRTLDAGEVDRVSLPMEPSSETLTAAERRVVTLVLAEGLAPAEVAAPEDPTLRGSSTDSSEAPTVEDRGPWVALRRVAQQHGARLDALADGTLVASFASSAGPIEHALKAAAYASQLREVGDGPAMAMATGLAPLRGELPFGELIDRAVASLRRARPSEIRLDDVTAGLLGTRYDVAGDERGLRLVDERGPTEHGRRLLGRQSPFVGRRRELKTLEALYEECVEDEVARVGLVTGVAGAGKSRLRDELLRRLQDEDPTPTVLVARADPVASSPLGSIADMVRRAAQLREGEPPRVHHERLRGRLARVVGQDPEALERCAAFLGELVGAPVPDERVGVELESARADARLMGDRMREAFEEWLRAEARLAPLVVVVEDLHWGDGPSVSFLDSALAHLSEAPWMLLAIARPEVHERFPRLWAGRHMQELRLPGLTKKASRALIIDVLGGTPDEALVEDLVERAQGNAFYLEELIRAVAEGRGEALPPTVLAMVQSRLERLPEESRRVLRAASVFGKTFWVGGLRALLGDGPQTSRLDDWLDELVRAELISPPAQGRFEGEDEHVFRHALLHEGAYATLLDEDRERGHRLAAAWLAEAGEPDASVLATHYELGGDPESAAPYFVQAGQQALEADDLTNVLALADRALEGATGEDRGRARLLQAEAHRWRGESALAFERALEAAQTLEEGTSRWYQAVTEALVASSNQQREGDVRELVTRAVNATPAEGTERSRGIFACRAYPMGAMASTGVVGLFEEVRRDVGSAPPEVRGWVASAEASVAARTGALGQSVRGWAVALSAFDEVGARRTGCLQRVNAGYLWCMLGDYERAEAVLDEARRTAEDLGLVQTGTYALHNRGLAVARAGRVEEGLALELDALAEAEAQENAPMIAACHLYVALISLDSDLDEALRHARRAAELLGEGRRSTTLALVVEAAALVRRGDPRAIQAGDRAWAAFQDAGNEELDPLVYVTVAECFDAAGRAEEAAAITKQGLEALEAAAALIDDPVLREQFLTRVPENAALLARAKG